jgi:hypothetical protein
VLRVDDLDFERRVIAVRRTWGLRRRAPEAIDPPKRRAGCALWT